MDSIPCEKVLHCVAEKNRTACFIKSHADGDLKNIALRAGWKGFFTIQTDGSHTDGFCIQIDGNKKGDNNQIEA